MTLRTLSRAAKTVRGWLCLQLVCALPVMLDSPVYCWLLGWAGWYAHGGNASEDAQRFV